MTDPTTGPPPLPGIHDYEAVVPLIYRGSDDYGRQGELRARIPAGNDRAALALAQAIGREVEIAVDGDDDWPSGWTVDHANITVTDVDDTKSPAEVAAEGAHWKRVVAALAAKYPAMLMLTDREYTEADPDDLRAHPVGDLMVFVTPTAYENRRPQPAPQLVAPGAEPELMPLGVTQPPAGHGGHIDPDSRCTRPHHLARYLPGTVEVFLAGGWARLDMATINHTDGTTDLDIRSREKITAPHDTLIICRPATIEGYGADLPAAALHKRQMLTGGGWWNVGHAEFAGDIAGSYRVLLESAGATRQTSIDRDQAVLLRATPLPKGWS